MAVFRVGARVTNSPHVGLSLCTQSREPSGLVWMPETRHGAAFLEFGVPGTQGAYGLRLCSACPTVQPRGGFPRVIGRCIE